jgi:hypothetical protein
VLETTSSSFSTLVAALEASKKQNLEQQEQLCIYKRLVATMKDNFRDLSCLYVLEQARSSITSS